MNNGSIYPLTVLHDPIHSITSRYRTTRLANSLLSILLLLQESVKHLPDSIPMLNTDTEVDVNS